MCNRGKLSHIFRMLQDAPAVHTLNKYEIMLLIDSFINMSFSLFPFQACAPRYVYHQHQPRRVERIEPVGTCFIAKDNFKEYHEYSPCRTSEFP